MGGRCEEKARRKLEFRNFLLFGFFSFTIFCTVIIAGICLSSAVSAASSPTVITYQGKLLTSGSPATTTLPMKFVIYTSLTGGTAVYTAAGTLPSTSSVSVTPVGGLFSVDLGSAGTNVIDPSIFQDNSNLYLEVNINGQTMSPRKRLTTAPYAFNSKFLDGVAATSTASASVYIPISDTSGNFRFNHVSSTGVYSSGVLSVVGNSALASTTVSGYLGVGTTTPVAKLSVDNGSVFFSGEYGSDLTVPVSGTGTRMMWLPGLSAFRVGYVDGNQWDGGSVGPWNVGNIGLYSSVIGGANNLASGAFSFVGGGNENFATNEDSFIGGGRSNIASGIASFIASGAHNIASGTATFVAGQGNIASGDNSAVFGQRMTVSGDGSFGINLSNSTNTVSQNNTMSIMGGRVGIGTVAPVSALQVVGNITNLITPSSGIHLVTSTYLSRYGAMGLAVSGHYAYVTNNLSPNGDSLTVLDITNPSAPFEVATTAVGVNPALVVVSGRYAYVTNATSNTVSIVDISNPFAPRQVSVVSVGSNPEGIAVSGHYIYVTNAYSNSISVVDVSDPVRARQVATISTDSVPHGIVISGRYAYVTNAFTNSISVVDISNPLSSYVVATTTVGALPTMIAVSGRFAYVTNANANTISVVDVSNPANPHEVATSSVGNYPNFVVVSGRYIYVGHNGSNDLYVLDVIDPTHPIQVSAVNASPGYVVGMMGLAISGHYVYVLDEAGIFSVIDITGTEVSSLMAHSAEVGNLQSDSDIFAQGIVSAGTSLQVGIGGIFSNGSLSISATNTASYFGGSVGIGTTTPNYTLTVSGTAYISQDLRVIGNTYLSGALFDGTNSTGTSGYVLSTTGTSTRWIAMSSSTPSVGASGTIQFSNGDGTFNASSGLFWDNTNSRLGVGTNNPSSSLQVVGNFSNLITANSGMREIAATPVGGGPLSIAISGRYAYVANANSDSISVVDISNPSAPVQIATTSVGDGPDSIAVSGRYAYVANGGSDSISVVDISNPSAPVQIATTSVGEDNPMSIAVSGRYAYVANSGGGSISVVDISNPSAPVQIAATPSGNNSVSIAISGSYAYVANWDSNSISVVDISNPSSPTKIAIASVGTHPRSITISGSYAYVANWDSNSISVVDISNPSAPVQIATTSVGLSPDSIAISGRYAYVANVNSFSISVVDILNPYSPVQISTATLGSRPYSIAISGRHVFLTSYTSNSISVVDITGTEVSSLMAHSAEVGNLQSNNDIFAQGIVSAGSSLQVGIGGIFSNGALSISATNTASYFGGSVGIGTTTPSTLLTVAGTSTLRTILPDMSGVTSSVSLYSVGSSSTRFSQGWFNEVYVGSSTWKLNQANGAFQITNVNTSTPAVSVLENGRVGIGTTSPNASLQVVGNISNLVEEKSQAREIATTTISESSTAVAVSGKYIYILSLDSYMITVMDVTNPLLPRQISTSSVAATSTAIDIAGNYLYVVNTRGEANGGISIFDISNHKSPRFVASTTVGISPTSVVVSGRYAYVANVSWGTMSVVDISNPMSPVRVADVSAGAAAIAVDVVGRYAYVANFYSEVAYGGALHILDVSNPQSPQPVASTTVTAGFVNSVRVSGAYAYLVSRDSDTFAVVDISNPSLPVEVSSIIVGDGPVNVQVSGRYAYTTNLFSGDVSIVDISDPVHPRKVNAIDVQGPPAFIAVSGKYAYTANNNVFSVIDITGTEVSSLMAHSAEVGNLQSDSDIFAQGIVSAGTSLQVGIGGIFSNGALTISATNTPSYFGGSVGIGTTTPNTRLSVSYDSTGISVSNTIYSVMKNVFNTSMSDVEGALYMGTYNQLNLATSTNANIYSAAFVNEGFYNSLVSLNTDLNLTAAGFDGLKHDVNIYTTNSGGGGDIKLLASNNGSIDFSIGGNGGVVSGSSMMRITTSGVGIGTVAPVSALQVVGNFTNLITAGSGVRQVATTAVGSNPYHIAISGHYAYVANYNSDSVSVVDISYPAVPVQVTTVAVGSAPDYVAISGHYAYVANSMSDSVSVLDISNPASSTQITSITVGDSPAGIAISGRYAYVTNRLSNSVSVLDVSNPVSLIPITVVSVGDSPAGIAISGRYAYVTNRTSNTVSVVDISNPAAPTQVTSVPTGNDPAAIAIYGHYAYVANFQSASLAVIDISNPASSTQIATTSVGVAPHGIAISGRYAYVANWNSASVSVVDISNPASSTQIATTSVGDSPSGVAVSGGYVYVSNLGSSSISVVDITGTEVSSLMAHSAAVGNLQSDNDIFAQGIVSAGTSLQVGIGGIFSNGALAILTTNTPSYFGGSVGIGTTSPTGLLHLYGGNATSTSLLTISTVAGNAFRFSASGTAYASSNWAAGGADYAEYFYTHDTDLVSGEAVCVDVTKNNAVKRCARGEDPDIIGIISTHPSIVGNTKDDYENNPNYKIVGMLGQIPAKVSVENGAVRPGDSLTSASSTPGYLMRANAGDPTVGVALESLDSSGLTGVVNVLISRRNKSLTVEQIEESVSKRVADMKIEDEVGMMVSNAVRAYDFSTADQLTALLDSKLQLFGDGFKTKLSNEVFVPFENKLSALSSSTEKLTMRMDDFDQSLGAVSTSLALFKSEYASTTNLLWDAINGVSTTVDKLATAIGAVPTSSAPTTLTVDQKDGYLVIKNNELNLNGAVLAGVLSIHGKNNKWKITDEGVLVSVVQTSEGDKDVYAMQSLSSELVFSGSAQLVNGEATINFDTSTSDMIDSKQPIKVSITLTSDEAKGIFVKAKDALGFAAKELMGGTSNATFDWVVVAKRGDGAIRESEIVPETETNSGDNATTSTDVVVVSSTPEAPVDNATSTVVATEKSETENAVEPATAAAPITETVPDTTVIENVQTQP